MAYDRPAINPDNIVKPWLDVELKIGVAKDLEAKRASFLLSLLVRVAVETGHEPVEGIEHGGGVGSSSAVFIG